MVRCLLVRAPVKRAPTVSAFRKLPGGSRFAQHDLASERRTGCERFQQTRQRTTNYVLSQREHVTPARCRAGPARKGARYIR